MTLRVPGLAKLRRAGAFARRRARPGVLVLMYHRVADPVVDPWDIAVHPDRFEEQMAVLVRRGGVATLADVCARLDRGRVERSVVVTFDDGYVDTLRCAAPVLERHGIPATVFATAGGLEGGDGSMWWDPVGVALLHDRPLPERLVLGAGSRRSAWAVPPPGGDDLSRWRAEPVGRDAGRPAPPRARLYLDVFEDLASRADSERAERVVELVRWAAAAGVEVHTDGDARALTAAELRELAASEQVSIGSHTITHPFLSRVDRERRQREIADSRAMLEDAVGDPVVDFSFPNGDVPADGTALARDAGYRSACTSRSARVLSGTDAFAIPRLVVRDWDARRFSLWLTGWGHA